jgi:enediyne biosynthesis protein E4
MAGGVAIIDYDNDGKPDIFFTNGAKQPSLKKEDNSFCNRLYRNKGNWTFEDATAQAGLCGEGYSIGVAVADYDNDGHSDLFVAGVNRNILYRNKGDGSFEDVSAKAGVTNDGRWAVAAGFLDYDNDGRLDLFIVNYVKWDSAKEPFCGDAKQAHRTYCHPKFYEGLSNILLHNNGDGTFTDVSAASGIAKHTGKGMGVAFADYDEDGRVDVFVANDTVPNFLFHNEGNGRFEETGFLAGVAMNNDGRALSSMGVDWRDLDNDGRPDLFVTALSNETFPYYRNQGKGVFADVTYQSKIGAATLPLSGWGAGIYDFDNDGRKDIFAACGDVQDNTEVYSSRKSRQPNLLLLNRSDGSFVPRTFEPASMYRGAAFADFDGDGRIDVIVTRLNERAMLLRNAMSTTNHWIGLQLEGTKSNRHGIGARVRVGKQWNHVTTSVGYASSSQREVHFGLGKEGTVEQIEIRWPSGVTQIVENPAVDQLLKVRESPTGSR